MTAELLTQLLANYFDNPRVTSCRMMSDGKENSSAQVKGNFSTAIVRVWGEVHSYMGKRQKSDIQSELALMDFCHAHRLPVPKLHLSKAGNLYEIAPDGAYYAVMEYVEGEMPRTYTPDMVRILPRRYFLNSSHQNTVCLEKMGKTLAYSWTRTKKLKNYPSRKNKPSRYSLPPVFCTNFLVTTPG